MGFYVEELKARFHDEKKIIKEILKEKEFEMEADTSFEEFATIVCEDKRSASLDAGNVKLTYNALQEKAESKDKERIKEETKKLRKLEGDLRALFTEINVEETSSWPDVMAKIQDKEAFSAVTETQAEKEEEEEGARQKRLGKPFPCVQRSRRLSHQEEKEEGDPFSFSLPRKASSLAHAVSIPTIQVTPSPRLGVTIIKTQAALISPSYHPVET